MYKYSFRIAIKSTIHNLDLVLLLFGWGSRWRNPNCRVAFKIRPSGVRNSRHASLYTAGVYLSILKQHIHPVSATLQPKQHGRVCICIFASLFIPSHTKMKQATYLLIFMVLHGHDMLVNYNEHYRMFTSAGLLWQLCFSSQWSWRSEILWCGKHPADSFNRR